MSTLNGYLLDAFQALESWLCRYPVLSYYSALALHYIKINMGISQVPDVHTYVMDVIYIDCYGVCCITSSAAVLCPYIPIISIVQVAELMR